MKYSTARLLALAALIGLANVNPLAAQEAPKDQPKQEQPAKDEPKPEQPKQDEPAKEKPSSDQPKSDKEKKN